MNGKKIKLIWQEQQLHWDSKKVIDAQKYPLCVVFNWRKLTDLMRKTCRQISCSLGHKINLIDIGCGEGGFYKGLEDAVKTYVGIDPSEKMLSYAERSSNQNFIRSSGEQLPVKNEFADLVVIKSVLDQCYNPDRLIAETYRVLKLGGYVLISLSNRDSYYKLIRRIYAFFKKSKTGHFTKDSHQFYFNIDDTVQLLRKHCFTPVKKNSFGYFVLPRMLQFIFPIWIYPYLIDWTDKIGATILPGRGGEFIILGQKLR